MRIKEIFSEQLSDSLLALLNKEGIKYTVIELAVPRVYFSLYRDQQNFSAFSDISEAECRVAIAEYSQAELNASEWLVFYPKHNRVEIINSDESFLYTCGSVEENRFHHREQVGTIRISSDIKWKQGQYFLASDTGFSEIYTNKAVAELIASAGVKGCRFADIVDRKGLLCANTFQLLTDAVLDESSFAFGYGEKLDICPRCGKRQYYYDGTYQLRIYRSALKEDVDFYMTPCLFGSGQAEPIYLISKRFYKLLKDNKMLRNTITTPVILV